MGAPVQIADGVISTVGAAAYTWEVRKLLQASQASSALGRTTIDGPCKIVCAYASVSPAAQFDNATQVPTTDAVLAEVNVNKTYQLTKEIQDNEGGFDESRSNAVTLTSLSSKDAVRAWMMELPAGQWEVTVRYLWRSPLTAAVQYIDVDCGLALVVQPPSA